MTTTDTSGSDRWLTPKQNAALVLGVCFIALVYATATILGSGDMEKAFHLTTAATAYAAVGVAHQASMGWDNV